MRIVGLDHLVLTVTDIDATARFFERLGMRREQFEGGRVALQFGAQKINLHHAGEEIKPHAHHPLPGSADLCLLIDDPVESAARELAQAGDPDRTRPRAAHRRPGADPVAVRSRP